MNGEIERSSVTTNNMTKELFGTALTFLSILLGVFTFSLMYSVKWKGEPEGDPWDLLALVAGFGIICSGLIAAISFLYYEKPVTPNVKRMLIFLVYAMILISGFGTPSVGLWLYITS